MANLLHSDSRRSYSWWWDSHISPKNSKWLQENLTDVDAKVKLVIKLIEEDADSFARRAEMYYKKRPELMKLVEELYRAYRALAERYDHATGALRQAHRTMSEAFPNQVPLVLADDSPSGAYASEIETHRIQTPHPIRALFDPDDLHKDALGLSSPKVHAFKRNGAYSDESDSMMSKKGLKQLNDLFGSGDGAPHHVKFAEGWARKGLNLHGEDKKSSEHGMHKDLPEHEMVEKEQSLHDDASDQNLKHKVKTNVQTLKEALAKLEAEKEAGLLQYQQALERLSNMEADASRAQEATKGLNERADKAEAEVQILKPALAKLETEREAYLLQYQQCLERISNLETKISHVQEEAAGLNKQATKAENEAQNLKQALFILEIEKEASLLQYNQCLEKISNMEMKISCDEEDARKLNERADRAEAEVQSLNQTIAKLGEEKEAAALQYQQCLETIFNLESKLSLAQEEAEMLTSEMMMGVSKLNSAEEQYILLERANQSLQMEVDTLIQKTGIQQQELLEKHEELKRLRICIQEEHLHSTEAEVALRTLQNLHSESQEEQKALALELQNGVQILKDMELRNQRLENEIQREIEEIQSLNEQNMSSTMLIKNLQDEIFSLREMNMKLIEQIELEADQRNVLQKDIYYLKEEINGLNRRHQGVMEQVESVGLRPDCLISSVKGLQDENSKLKEMCQKDKDEKAVLFEKLENMEKILEDNALLGDSLSNVKAKLQVFGEKVRALEETCQSLQIEKSTLAAEKAILVSQLDIATRNMEKLSENIIVMENSLSVTNFELLGSREKSKSLEEFCHALNDEKSGLLAEIGSLVSQLKSFQHGLEDAEKRYAELKEEHQSLEEEKESKIHRLEELQASLDIEKQEHVSFLQASETRLSHLEDEIHKLQEEGWWRKKEFEEEQDKAMRTQFEIFILQKCIRDMEEKNFSLLIECQKRFEASKLSEKLISKLELESLDQQLKIKSLLKQVENLRMGIQQVLKSLKIDPDYVCQDKIIEDQGLQRVLGKIEGMESALLETQDEKQQLLFEKSVLVTLLRQLRLEAVDLESKVNTLGQEFKIKTEDLLMLQSEKHKLLEINGHLRLEVRTRYQRGQVLNSEMENQCTKLLDLQKEYLVLQNENSKLAQERRYLMKQFSELEEETCMLEEDNSVILGEAMALDNLSLIFKMYGSEKAEELKDLSDVLEHLYGVNCVFEEEIRIMEERLKSVEMENLHLKEFVEVLGNELNTIRNASDQLNHQIGIGKDLLSQKEMDLSETEQKLKATESENTELHRDIEDLTREYEEAMVIREVLEKKIVKLSEDNMQQNKDIRCLHEVNKRLESEVAKLHEEIGEHKTREENFSYELQKKSNEVNLWETEASTLYGDLEISNIHAALLKEKVCELVKACVSLEDENSSKTADIVQLKEKLCAFEGENEGMKSELAAYLPVVMTLRDNIASLEDHVFSQTKIHVAANQETEDIVLASPLHDMSCEHLSEDRSAMVADGVSNLLELQTRVKDVEKAVTEKIKLVMQDSLDTTTKLEAAMKEIKELKSKTSSNQGEEAKTSRDVVIRPEEELRNSPSNLKLQKTEFEISNTKEILMKDIPLDQVSNCSSYDRGFGLHVMGRGENVETDEKLLELWETAEQGCNIGSAPIKDNANCHLNETVEQKSEYPSSELQAELSMDKIEVTKSVAQIHCEGNKKNSLERLASDARKLTNLQVTVQDLKMKVEKSEKCKKPKNIQYSTVRGTLQEVDKAVMQLIDINRKLTKNAKEGGRLSFDGKNAVELEDTGKVHRHRFLEQAQQGSEKITHLQLEVQRIQSVLLKLDDEQQTKGTRVTDRKILLRDYLYGFGSSSHRQKKAPFCACVRPPNKVDWGE